MNQEVAKEGEEVTTHETEIIEVPPQTITPHNQDNSIEGFISAAIEAKLPIETMKEFLAMRKELKADQAKEAFTIAMAQFQRDCPVIAKTKEVLNKDKTAVTYRYAPIDSIILQVKDVLAKHNLAYDFSEERTDKTITATCTITLPTATGSGQAYYIHNMSTGTVTVDGNSTDTINGDLTQELTQHDSIHIVDYGTGTWAII